MAVFTVEPASKTSFVFSCMQTRLIGQYDWKWPITLSYVSKPLTTGGSVIDPKVKSEIFGLNVGQIIIF